MSRVLEPNPFGYLGYSARIMHEKLKLMLKKGRIDGIAESGEAEEKNPLLVPWGVHRDCMDLFQPMLEEITAFHSGRSLEFWRFVRTINKEIEKAGTQSDGNYDILMRAWFSKACAFIEHIPLEKRVTKKLMPWEKEFLPELCKFFEILYQFCDSRDYEI